MTDYYEDKNGNFVDSSFTRGTKTIPNDPASRGYQSMQSEVAAGDSQIIPWSEYRDVSDDELRELVKNDNAEYAQGLIDAAESNPAGTPLSKRDTEKENGRRNWRARGIGKTTADDDKLADYVDSVYDTLDTKDAAADTAPRVQLENWSPEAGPWPPWNPGQT